MQGSGSILALFVGTDANGLLNGSPISIPSQAGSIEVPTGTRGVEHFAVLGVADGSSWISVGPVLRSIPSAHIFVRVGSNSGIADGLSPQTAFATLEAAVTQASNQGMGNLWVSGGTYQLDTLVVPRGVRMYGGF